jgi:carbonic anhydrase
MIGMPHRRSCACTACGDMIREGLARRGFLGLLTASAASLALAPVAGVAQSSGGYKAMLLSCVDPRTQTPIADWMNMGVPDSHAGSLQGKYSQFTFAGAAVGAIAPAFAAWRETFWANLGASIQLHKIGNLLVVDHGNCGALGIAYGEEVLNNPQYELAAHLADTKALQQELSIRHPQLAFQAWFVDRDAAGVFNKWRVLVPGPPIS